MDHKQIKTLLFLLLISFQNVSVIAVEAGQVADAEGEGTAALTD